MPRGLKPTLVMHRFTVLQAAVWIKLLDIDGYYSTDVVGWDVNVSFIGCMEIPRANSQLFLF